MNFDTAHGYGFGSSERLLGAALRDKIRQERDKVVIATKGGLRQTEAGLVRDASPAWLRKGVEDSLRFLGTDYIDLYQVHWPDPHTPFAETAGGPGECVREGKVRYAGVSNFSAAELAEMGRFRRADTLQSPYSLWGTADSSLAEVSISLEILPLQRLRRRPKRVLRRITRAQVRWSGFVLLHFQQRRRCLAPPEKADRVHVRCGRRVCDFPICDSGAWFSTEVADDRRGVLKTTRKGSSSDRRQL